MDAQGTRILDHEVKFAGCRACVLRGGPVWAGLLALDHGDKTVVLVAEVEAGRELIARAAARALWGRGDANEE